MNRTLLETLRPLAPHLLFAAYAFLIAPIVQASLANAAVDEARPLGWAILALLLLEIPALHVLLKDAAYRAGKAAARDDDAGAGDGNGAGTNDAAGPGVTVFLAWLAHMLIVIIMYFQALRALGRGDSLLEGGWPVFLIPLLVIKEIYVLVLLLGKGGASAGSAPVLFIANAVLFLFTCLVHTAYWGLLMHDPQFSGYSTPLFVMSTLVFGLFFAVFYAAVQLPAVRLLAAAGEAGWGNWVPGLAIAALSALWPFLSVELRGRYTELSAAAAHPAEVRLLALQQGDLKTIPAEVFRFAGLRKLYLFENEIVALPPAVGRLNRLEHLSLGYNKIAVLPPEIGDLTRLKTLNVYVNRLTALPPAIGRLTALEELNAGWNGLATLPPEIGNLENLRVLKLSRNRLTVLPPQIGRLQKLRKLDLTKNGLRTLPEEFYRLELDELKLGDNPLDARTRERLKREMPDTKLTL